MSLPSIFNSKETEKLVARIERLSSESQPLWGKMSVAQMMAHCALPYEMDHRNPPKIGFFLKWMMKLFFKKSMLNDQPYHRNIQTAPPFRMVQEKEFYEERKRLIALIQASQAMGEGYYQGLPHYALGPLSSKEWSTLLFKHLDHHLRQFGV
jgi:hypothetical protein